ncbi:hypothetical protein [Goodfellowiella coeruleoviolacea]|uniref:Uncharacterized protein n=1 Tax=Goodfellowiella coeruleoviolacea TaxID=334858 RepID=A0AAE3KGL7_9PSEU|nr:hypothetical protein [Goodfellowiella coeruleoviolacea]MCP2166042.1 hypothetical protein [Goodfellowiella coeruleoviolacea]
MEFDGDLERQQRIIGLASAVLGLIARDEADRIPETVAQYLKPATEPEQEFRLLASVTVRECAALAGARMAYGRERNPDLDNELPFRIETGSEGQRRTLGIDELPPPLRTVVRTMLAEGYGDPRTADELVDIALREATQHELHFLLSASLMFTVQLANECLRLGIPMADWVRAALAPE